MGAPVWVTTAGDLGKLQEGEFYELALDATDPDGGTVSYQVIAGYMPPGLILDSTNGGIYGRPKNTYLIGGVPVDVSEDTTSKFCIRATSDTGGIADRTFEITIAGQDAPVISTSAGELARVLDGTFIDITVEAFDLDNEPIHWSLADGELPPGISLDTSTGRLSGYVLPSINTSQSVNVGWDAPAVGWSEAEWDISDLTWSSENYQFKIQVTDGKEYVSKIFTIFVYDSSLLSADNDDITVDEDQLITADAATKRTPALLTPGTDLGIVQHDNYFAFQFKGIDFDGDQIEFGIGSTTGFGFDETGSGFDTTLFDQGDLLIPTGLTLNKETGWFYGYLDRQSIAQIDYQFTVYVYKKSQPNVRSRENVFTITVVNDFQNAVTWNTNSDLGIIRNGEISELAVSASNTGGLSLSYEIVSGRLPQGLRLLSSGLIVGRPSFENTTFDNGTTTFDIDVREVGADLSELTFDREYEFSIQATSTGEQIAAEKTFRITVDPQLFSPYESLYLRATPGLESKQLFRSITSNTDVFPGRDIYRGGDPNFGRSDDARMLLASSISASSLTEYIAAMSENHYRKTLKFGEPKIGRAYDTEQNLIYEVIYLEINDGLENSQGSVKKQIDLNGKIVQANTVTYDSETTRPQSLIISDVDQKTVYPNSLTNMRRQIFDQLGIATDGETLPQWMKNRQPDGTILGWQPAVTLAFMKPGTANRALFKLKRQYDLEQLSISFEIDRYILDNNLTSVYDLSNDRYFESDLTSFDAEIESAGVVPEAAVDFALSLPFSEFHGRTADYIYRNGGLDGITAPLNELEVIFAEPELYDGYTNLEYNGWAEEVDFWSDNSGWDSNGWGEYTKINGYQENFGSTESVDNIEIDNTTGKITVVTSSTHDFVDGDLVKITNVVGTAELNSNSYFAKKISSTEIELYTDRSLSNAVDGTEFGAYSNSGTVALTNQRSGVWRFVFDEDNDFWLLEFVKEIELGEYVRIENGAQYGNTVLRYGPGIRTNEGRTVPRYEFIEGIDTAVPTTFDSNSTRFLNNISTYEEPDANDKYLVFPKNTIWA